MSSDDYLFTRRANEKMTAAFQIMVGLSSPKK